MRSFCRKIAGIFKDEYDESVYEYELKFTKRQQKYNIRGVTKSTSKDQVPAQPALQSTIQCTALYCNKGKSERLILLRIRDRREREDGT